MKILVDGELIDAAPEVIADIEASQEPAVPERRRVSKALVRQRVAEAGKIAAAVQLIISNPEIFSRWTLPGSVDVFADDPDTIAIIQAIGLNPAQILAE